MRIIIVGDGLWAAKSLNALVEEGFIVVAVVERQIPSDSYLRDRATILDIPVYRLRDINSVDSVEKLGNLQPDLIVSIAYDQIFRGPALRVAKTGTINLHAGLLPAYRGRNVINWAIINGEKEVGLTSHFINEGIDSGDLLIQNTLPIGWRDDYNTMLKKVQEALPKLAVETCSSIVNNAYARVPQPEDRATYMPGREEGDEWIDWSDKSINIYNKIRGITRPGPGAVSIHNGKRVTILRAEYELDWPDYAATPGVVVGRNRGKWVNVKTGDSVIRVHEIEDIEGNIRPPTWSMGTRLGYSVSSKLNDLDRRVKTLESLLKELKMSDPGVK